MEEKAKHKARNMGFNNIKTSEPSQSTHHVLLTYGKANCTQLAAREGGGGGGQKLALYPSGIPLPPPVGFVNHYVKLRNFHPFRSKGMLTLTRPLKSL